MERKIFRSWYCANIHPYQENRTEERVQHFTRIETWRPTFIHAPPPHEGSTRKRKESVRSVFPGYLFLRFSKFHDAWERLHTIEGVKKLFSCGPFSPTALLPSAMAHIQKEVRIMNGLDAPTIQPEVKELIEVGASLRVVSGPFASFPAIAQESTEGRIKALVEIFGRSSEIEFNRADVELV